MSSFLEMTFSRGFLFSFLILHGFSQGCGYAFQSSKSDLYRRKGVTRLYVAPFLNNSYKPGVENMIYNSVMRVLSAGRRFQLVDEPLEADAILISSVEDANYVSIATAVAKDLPPSSVPELKSLASPEGFRANGSRIPNPKFDTMPVATEYNASVSCQFRLEKVGPQLKGWIAPTPTYEELRQRSLPPSKQSIAFKTMPGPGTVLWSETVSRTQSFQGYNQLGAFGTTSPLMNESEFVHAIQELSGLLANDMHDRMFQAF